MLKRWNGMYCPYLRRFLMQCESARTVSHHLPLALSLFKRLKGMLVTSIVAFFISTQRRGQLYTAGSAFCVPASNGSSCPSMTTF